MKRARNIGQEGGWRDYFRLFVLVEENWIFSCFWKFMSVSSLALVDV